MKITKKNYAQQYSHVYSQRLNLLRTATIAKAQAAAPTAPSIDRIIELPESILAIATGIIIKSCALRKEVVGDFAEDAQIKEDEASSLTSKFKTMSSPDDEIVLEDGSGRVALVLSGDSVVDEMGENLKVCELVTGVVVSAVGVVQVRGSKRREQSRNERDDLRRTKLERL